MAKTLPFTGSGVALVTPFKGYTTDYDALGELIEWHIANGTDAIIICGTTGENPTLPDDEHLEIMKYTVEKAAGRICVVAGTGSNDTAHAIRFAKEAEQYGADAILQATPYYNKTTQKGLIAHFKAIAESVDLPMILYNVPSRTGMTIQINTLKELARIENIVGIKEASGNISYVAQIAAEVPELYIYSGNDDMIVPMMSLGGKGVISVLANVKPKETHEMCQACFDGDYDRARELQLEYLDLINALFIEVNPIPVKAAMNLMGLKAGDLRLPMSELTGEKLEKLKEVLKKHGMI